MEPKGKKHPAFTAQSFTTEGNECMSTNIGKVGDAVNMKGGHLTVTGNIGDSIYMGEEHKKDEHKEGHVDKINDKTHGKGGHEHKEGHDGEKKKERGHEHDGHSSSIDSYSG